MVHRRAHEGVGSPVVVLSTPGSYEIGMRLFDLEATHVVEVVPGDPVAIVFPTGMSMRSGQGLLLRPSLVDANGFSMPYDAVGGLRWSSNHGVVDTDGVFPHPAGRVERHGDLGRRKPERKRQRGRASCGRSHA